MRCRHCGARTWRAGVRCRSPANATAVMRPCCWTWQTWSRTPRDRGAARAPSDGLLATGCGSEWEGTVVEAGADGKVGAAGGSAAEVFAVFLKLGLTSFGGPIAH